MSLILVTLMDGLCAIEFIGSDTTAQVATSAGTSRQSGISETLSTGIVNNDAFAVVSQDAQGNGSGSATATIQVDPLGQPKEMFAFMQVTASALPEFDSGTFAEAKVTYFFSNPIEIKVERGIDQGDTRFFIDNVRKPLLGSVARFTLPQGLHSFEIEVVPGTTVVNPNISVRIFALDNSDDDSGPTTSPTLNDRLDEAVSIARSIKSKLTKQNRNAQRLKLISPNPPFSIEEDQVQYMFALGRRGEMGASPQHASVFENPDIVDGSEGHWKFFHLFAPSLA